MIDSWGIFCCDSQEKYVSTLADCRYFTFKLSIIVLQIDVLTTNAHFITVEKAK